MSLDSCASDSASRDCRLPFDGHDIFRDLAGIESLDAHSFPQPLHAQWDLDALVDERPDKSAGELPHWVRCLTAAEATRLLQICDVQNAKLFNSALLRRELDAFFGDTDYFQTRESERSRVVSQLAMSPALGTKTAVAWLRKHGFDDFPEETGTYIQKPGMLRVQEQKKLVKPNLKHLFEQHFAGHMQPRDGRTLMDVGSWDGEIPDSLRSIFPNAVAVEQNEDRFDQLLEKESDRFHCVHASLQDMMADPSLIPMQPDAMYMGHIHYFLQQDGSDYASLDWMVRTLRPGGLGVVTLNDLFREPCSRAELRHAMRVFERNPNPEQYRLYLENRGVQTRVMRPTLSVTAKTENGLVAMRDLMRFLLPGEARHKPQLLDEYLQYVRDAGGVFRHTLYMMAIYKDANKAPVQPPYLPSIVAENPWRHRAEKQPQTAPLEKERPPLDLSGIDPIESIAALTPRRILDILDFIQEQTDGGTYDMILTKILDHLQLARVHYLDLVQSRPAIEEADARGDAAIAVRTVRRKKKNARAGRARTENKPVSPATPRERIASAIREHFPNGMPSPLSLRAAGLRLEPTDTVTYSLLARSADDQRAQLEENFRRTQVKPVRSLISALLSLSDAVRNGNGTNERSSR